MAVPNQSSAKCEVRSVIRFLNAKWTSSGNSKTNCCCLW